MGGAIGGATGYAIGLAAEETYITCALYPGTVPKANAIAGAGIGAMYGTLIQSSIDTPTNDAKVSVNPLQIDNLD